MIEIQTSKGPAVKVGHQVIYDGKPMHLVGCLSVDDNNIMEKLFQESDVEDWEELADHPDDNIRMLVVDNLAQLEKLSKDSNAQIRRKARLYMSFAA